MKTQTSSLMDGINSLNKIADEQVNQNVQKLIDKDIFDQAILAMEEHYGSGCQEQIDAYFRGAKCMQKSLNKNKLKMKTKNYNLFSFKKENRGISRQKISQLKENFLKFGYDENYPVLIDESFLIIDGQHRFTACKELNLEVIYAFSKNNTNEYMRSLNIVSSAWELADYIRSYASEKRECYSKLLEFKNNHNLTMSNAIIVFFGNAKAKQIRLGVEIKPMENAEKVVNALKSFSLLKFNNSKNFTLALQTIITKNISDKHLNFLIEKQLLINEMASQSQYLLVFENLINNRRGVRENVYFN